MPKQIIGYIEHSCSHNHVDIEKTQYTQQAFLALIEKSLITKVLEELCYPKHLTRLITTF